MMNVKKKQKFIKWYKFSTSLNSNYHGKIEECKNGYTIYVYNFEDFVDILNLLGQMPAFDMINFEYDFKNITEVYYEKIYQSRCNGISVNCFSRDCCSSC
ncbi:hypothetical protein EFM11_06820 [Lactobacillus helveticus]|nr:hypothetical protein [Lactobacillus helveticus]